MRALPAGWTTAKLGGIAGKGQYGWTTKATGAGSVQFLRTTDITKRSIDWRTVPWCEEVPSDVAKYRLAPGDIVISRAGSVGFSKLLVDVPRLVVFASYLIRFKPSEVVEPRYLAAYLRSDSYWAAIARASAGIAVSNVNASSLAELEVPLAPANEQRRIADKLDTVLARVDAVNDCLARVAPLLKRFRQSVLAAATSGKLTEEWRKSAGTSEGSWRQVAVCEMAAVVDPHPSHRTPPEVLGGVPYVSIGDIDAQGNVVLEGARRVGLEVLKEHRDRYAISPGDFIFGKIGTLGKPARLPVGASYTISANVLLIQPRRDVALSEFAYLLFQSPDFMTSVMERSTATSQAAFGIKKMRESRVLLPMGDEQAEIVRRVELLFAYADRLEARLQAAQTAADRLTPALLAKAFRGELVPQDPNDEPASELLKRLAAQREQGGTSSARPRGRRPAASTS